MSRLMPIEHFLLDGTNQIVIRLPMIRFLTSLRLRLLVPSILMLAACSGLTYQAVRGERGLIGWQKLQIDRTDRQYVLDELKAENDRLAARADRLREKSLDIDFLDERARIVLGLAQPDEIIVLNRHIQTN